MNYESLGFSWIVCLTVQLVFCSLWISVGSSLPVRDNFVQPGQIVITCDGMHVLWAGCTIAFLGFQVIFCFFIAQRDHRVNLSFDDPKFVKFSMLVCSIVFAAFLPAYSSTQGKFNVGTQMFAISATAYSLLVPLFIPKCYALLKVKY